MSDSRATLQLPDTLRGLIRSEKCVVFVGSGLSAGSYLPWPDLVNALCESCGVNDRVSSDSPSDALLDAAQSAKDRCEKSYRMFLGTHFGNPANHASLLYDSLLALPFECYLTVNFDPLLALKSRTAKRACSLPVRAYPNLDRKYATKRSIHYLHGHIEEYECPAVGQIVLARKEFDDAYDNNSNLMNFLVPTLENDPIVFVGCRLREPAMTKVFEISKEHQRQRLAREIEQGRRISSPPKRFIILPEPVVYDAKNMIDDDLSRVEMEQQDSFYKDRDIVPVWYAATGPDHSALRYAFDKLAELPDVRPRFGWDGGVDVN